MTSPVFYQTLNMVGVDPTLYYTNIETAGGSVTPEYPAPPFIPGTRAFGTDGSEFIFVQASTSISLTDFVVINAGNTSHPFMANSITTTLATPVSGSPPPTLIGSSGLVLQQSVSYIPAGAMFWACTKGNFIPATTSTGINVSGNVVLFTTTTPGQLTIGSSTATGVQLAGIAVVSSIQTSIPASVVPAGIGGTQSNGYTVGPVLSLDLPRPVGVAEAAATSVFW